MLVCTTALYLVAQSNAVQEPFMAFGTVPKAVAERLENLTFPGYPPMATPNCSTYGHPNCPRRDGQIMGFVVGVCDGFLG
jgi:hypothetical protein